MDKENKNKNKLNIELSDEVASGIYSNLAVINHSVSEFFIDFIQLMPNVPKAKVAAKISKVIFLDIFEIVSFL